MKLHTFNGIIRVSYPLNSAFDLFREIGKRIDLLRPATKCDFGSFAKSDWAESTNHEMRAECRIALLAPDQRQATTLLLLLGDTIKDILGKQHPGFDDCRTQAFIEVFI
jgi:hypothetical protein